MAEEPDVQDDEITLDDFNADEKGSPKADSSPAEDKKPESDKTDDAVVEETKDKPEADDTADKSEEPKAKETDTEAEKGDETETDKPQKGLEKRTDKLNTEIRDLVAQRNALKSEVAKANEVYQPATEQDLVDEGLSATDAKVEAMRQSLEVRDYNERVTEAQLTIESESNRVLTDFAWANPDSTDYKEELSQEAAQLLQSNLVTDPNTGQIIGSNISPYQLYKTLDRAAGISATQGQLKGQQATEKMLANADTASNAAPPKAKEDPLMALWKSDD